MDIADYIEASYNNVRLHCKLGNLPTNASEQQSAIKQPSLCPEILTSTELGFALY